MRYKISVKNGTTHDWSDWFQELQVQAAGEGGQQSEVRLTGCLPDQSALLGVLMRLHNLNLTILSIQLIDEGEG